MKMKFKIPTPLADRNEAPATRSGVPVGGEAAKVEDRDEGTWWWT
jgi:hypothetical protein